MQRILRLMRVGAVAAVGALLPATGIGAPPRSGAATYQRLCVSCHGDDGRGNPEKAKAIGVDPALLDLGRPAVAGLTRDERREIILKGRGKMPAYEMKLKPDEVGPLLEYTLGLIEALKRPNKR